MATGFAEALVLHSREVFAGARPTKKVTTPGYLKFLLQHGTPEVLGAAIDPSGTGHVRDVRIKYKQRVIAGKTVTSDDCSVQASPAYLEASVPALSFRKYSMFIDDTTAAKYTSEASKLMGAGSNPDLMLMDEMWDNVLDAANGLFADINTDLLAAAVANYGVNAATGVATTRTVNFPLSTATSNLAAGMPLIGADMLANQLNLQDTAIIGSGLIANWYMQQPAFVPANGLDHQQIARPDFYYDAYAPTALGANIFIVAEKGAVQFINVNRFKGSFGGDKLRTILGTINLPVFDTVGGSLQAFKFDFQLRYNECPTSMVIGGGDPAPVGRGWILDLMANYKQFNRPTNTYAVGDPLSLGNGTFKYLATNA